jgi:hypothetical protein
LQFVGVVSRSLSFFFANHAAKEPRSMARATRFEVMSKLPLLRAASNRVVAVIPRENPPSASYVLIAQ